MAQPVSAPASRAREQVTALQKRMAESIVGQEHIIERLIIGLLSNGNLLVEGLPGLAKTRAVKSLAKNLDAGLSRIQFTPDLLPSDITGTEVYYQADGKSEVPIRAGAHLQQPDPRRRDQSRAGEGAGRAPRGDGGAAGHGRRQDTQAAAAVPGDGHAEPDRTGGNVSAARSADGSLPDARAHRLSGQGG
jgi:hypothetical protein